MPGSRRAGVFTAIMSTKLEGMTMRSLMVVAVMLFSSTAMAIEPPPSFEPASSRKHLRVLEGRIALSKSRLRTARRCLLRKAPCLGATFRRRS